MCGDRWGDTSHHINDVIAGAELSTPTLKNKERNKWPLHKFQKNNIFSPCSPLEKSKKPRELWSFLSPFDWIQSSRDPLNKLTISDH